ncbi:hypothetical protein LH29_24250, partial [Draconibacterium sediminis]
MLFSFSNVQAQSIDKLEQFANGALKDALMVPSLTSLDVDWVTGNVNAAKAHYACGMTIPYRLQVSGLTPGNYQVVIGYDTHKSDKHAIDYLTSFDRDTNHDRFPHSPEDVLGQILLGTDLEEVSVVFDDYPLPVPFGLEAGDERTIDGFLYARDVEGYGDFRIYTNGDVPVNATLTFDPGDPLSDVNYATSDYLVVDFTIVDGQSIVVFAWGGNIACEDLWGEGSSAADIQGSPYHMFNSSCINLGGCGSKEVQLSATAVVAYAAPTCELIATDVECFGESTGSLTLIGTENGGSVAPFWIEVYDDTDPFNPVLKYEGATEIDGTFFINGLPAAPYRTLIWNSEQDVAVELAGECLDTIFQAEECTVTITPPAGYDLGCNGTWPTSLTADVLVDCGTDGSTNTTVESDGGVLQAPQGCVQSRLYTFTYTDDCGNTDTKTTTLTMKVDLTAPEITANSDDDLGCNPTDAEIETALGSASATDNCDDPGDITITSRDETGGEPCAMWAVRTFYAEDLCGNIDSAKVRVDWKVDLT